MKNCNNAKIIGIDHGYRNMKTTNFCFPTGITTYDHEPLFTADMLVYGGRYYLIGEGHKEFAPDKIKDEDYLIRSFSLFILAIEPLRAHMTLCSRKLSPHSHGIFHPRRTRD